VIFDLDGTLVETERLTALSYARAAAARRLGLVPAACLVIEDSPAGVRAAQAADLAAVARERLEAGA
jgi:beta-phosphoglucomutase-like phosphatase (HAD superfamily)